MFIKGVCKCKQCNSIIYFYWMLPGSKAECVPQGNYIGAYQDHFGGCYHIFFSCKKCGTGYTLLYDDNG